MNTQLLAFLQVLLLWLGLPIHLLVAGYIWLESDACIVLRTLGTAIYLLSAVLLFVGALFLTGQIASGALIESPDITQVIGCP